MGLSAVARVRVLLLDGLGLSAARALPQLGAACARGLDLTVDTGFPTVSLPVQNVLWTGLTQRQSGILYRLLQRNPVAIDALPARVPGSLAVAEAHNEIAGSFAFAHLWGPVAAKATSEADLLWRKAGFVQAAGAAWASSAPLVFVHVLRIDEAGHAHGAASSAYATAAREADALVGAWLAADEPGLASGQVRWFILSDHGHRLLGGHADAEPEVRLVRACVFGEGIERHFADSPIHLVDLHRALGDSLGLAPNPGAVGRPLPFALEHPDLGATLPRASLGRWAVAMLALLAATMATALLVRRRIGLLPLWPLVAAASAVAVAGPITLSNPIVYPPLGLSAVWALSPGLVLLALQTLWFIRRHGVWPTIAAALALPAATMLAAAVLCGAADAYLGWLPPPPLVPIWTAVTCVAATACAASCLVLALALILTRLVRFGAARGGSLSR